MIVANNIKIKSILIFDLFGNVKFHLQIEGRLSINQNIIYRHAVVSRKNVMCQLQTGF